MSAYTGGRKNSLQKPDHSLIHEYISSTKALEEVFFHPVSVWSSLGHSPASAPLKVFRDVLLSVHASHPEALVRIPMLSSIVLKTLPPYFGVQQGSVLGPPSCSLHPLSNLEMPPLLPLPCRWSSNLSACDENGSFFNCVIQNSGFHQMFTI